MARIRTIKPEFWDDEKLASISRDARLLFVGLWNQSDDYGVVKGHPSWLKNKIFPYDDIRPTDFQRWLAELEAIKAILPFVHDQERYYFIRTFKQHQVVNRPSSTRNPTPPDDINDPSRQAHGVFHEPSRRTPIRKGREGKGKEYTHTVTPPCDHGGATVGEGERVSGDKEKRRYLDHVLLTNEEYQKLTERFGSPLTNKAIEILNQYIGSTGKRYKSHYYTLLGWPMERAQGNNGSSATHITRGGNSNARHGYGRGRTEPELPPDVLDIINNANRLSAERKRKTEA